ncbi:MAG: hypothetical protein OXR82_16140 [Gammaproteobacteria bacterium]|nr:hypothetical protein [Gammaproteobacteria bacterium]MDE0259902.1 hypothetical protein [Gammaproteobacteria bacterium]
MVRPRQSRPGRPTLDDAPALRKVSNAQIGYFQIEWRENGRRLTRSLGHREWVRAKRQADEFAAGFAAPDLNGKAEAEPEPLTPGTLLDIYDEEATPTKGGADPAGTGGMRPVSLQGATISDWPG